MTLQIALNDVPTIAATRPGVPRFTLDDASSVDETAKPTLFRGLSHAEVLDLTFGDEPSELVEGLVPAGALVTVAGLPETFKGWLCAKLAACVATGAGELFGRATLSQGTVGYVWQDDSTRAEAERIQLFARVHETPRDIPLHWYLNEGLTLPDHLEQLRAAIEEHGFALVILDSLYNLAPAVDLKDRDVGALYARLKLEVCDPTGCTVVVVDHMPWATETNRKRLRGYGDVFKNAAVRAGIYIDAGGSKLFVEARGNNITGFKRTPAYWDSDALELRLVDTTRQEEADDELDVRVLEWLVDNPGPHSTTRVRNEVKGQAKRIDHALERLKGQDEVRDHGRGGGTWSGRSGDARFWIASVHAGNTPSQLPGTRSDEVTHGSPTEETSSTASAPRRGDEVEQDGVRGDVERVPSEAAKPSSVSESSTRAATAARATDDLLELVEKALP